jgi:hypothetical protein
MSISFLNFSGNFVLNFKAYSDILSKSDIPHLRLEAITSCRVLDAFSTPGLNSALLTGLKFFAITWTISTPGLKRYTIRSRHRFAEVKKAFILFSCNK